MAEPIPVWLINCGACGAQVGVENEIVFWFPLVVWGCGGRWGLCFLIGISCVSGYESLPCVFGLGLPLPTVGSPLAVMVRSCYDLYGWYFPDVLWDRRELFVFSC